MIERLPGTPRVLRERMISALPDDTTGIPEALAEAALSLYAEVLTGSGGREDALPLLAADALLTHAFHAQAELDPARVADLVERQGVLGRLGELAAGIRT